MTNDLERRMYEHKHKLVPSFSSRYNVDRLVHIDEFSDVDQAMDREREPKGWRRGKKIDLIEQYNPGWHDLTAGWFPQD
ncbi:hypothetical protein BH23CHL2_BH23CHL2_12260 [soil metagenome]